MRERGEQEIVSKKEREGERAGMRERKREREREYYRGTESERLRWRERL